MNRNSESRFAQLPSLDIGRSRFDMSHQVTFTMNGGLLVPFEVVPVLPGDTWEVSTSKVVRLQTLLHPIFGQLYMDVYHFFVPARLTWTHWKEFCGENTANHWIPNVTYTIPKIQANFATANLDRFIGSMLDYMGIGIGPQIKNNSNMSFNALPFRAFALIWNEFFRDENLQDPLNVPLGDASTRLQDLFPHAPGTGGTYSVPPPVCKYHDYFTSALPGVQKGPSTTFVLGVSAPLSASYADVVTSALTHDVEHSAKWTDVVHNTTGYSIMPKATSFSSGQAYQLDFVATSGGELPGTFNSEYSRIAPNNLRADLSGITADLSNANTINVNDLRLAFAVQRFYEALARGGSRYTEILQNLFKVRSPDARLQRPEYIGGNRIPISVHQVVNTAQTATADLGNLGAYSITTDRHNDFIYSATEHGFIISCCCVRFDRTYSQGTESFWFDNDRFDLYWPQMANLGEQPIRNREIYYTNDTTDAQAFGFQEAWASYRYRKNRVAGEMRPGITNSLASWTLGDYYTSMPYLSDAWIREDIAPIDRAIAVPSSTAHQFLCDFWIDAKVTRPMPLYSVPGLIDHH